MLGHRLSLAKQTTIMVMNQNNLECVMKIKILVLVLLLTLGGVAVYADCSTNTPADGSVVTCTGGDDDAGDANNAQETTQVGAGTEDNVTVNVSGTGDIQTANDGIGLDENANINNDGNINQNGTDGVDVNTGTVNNNASGTINQNGDDGVDVDTSATVNNAGEINQNGESGVDSDGDLILNNSGSINDNGEFGVDILANGTINNSGSINENDLGGIVIFAGNVTNSGTIDNNEEQGVLMFQGSVQNFNSITNNDLDGVTIITNGQVANSGRINNNGGDGVVLIDGGAVLNTGQIQNNTLSGIYLAGNGTVTNNGIISGNDAGGANLQILFDDCGCGGQNTFTQNQNGQVIGVNGQVAIQMGDDDDTVFVDIRSEVVGIIDGGTHGTGDRLVFTLSSADANELAQFAQFMAGVQISSNTLTYQGRTFNWQNFEELATIIQDLAQEVAVESGGGDGGEGSCANSVLATFRLPNRDLAVYSGFDLNPPGGFLVGVISMAGLQNGERRFSDSGGLNPGWYVEASQVVVGRWRANVFDANGTPIGACDFLFTLNDNAR